MSRELVTYIILGSRDRLKNIKIPQSSSTEEYIPANLEINGNSEKKLDDLVGSAKGNIIVFLPPSSQPTKKSKEILEKISMIDISSWGWFKFSSKKKNFLNNIKKISTQVRSIPDIEQGIFFNKGIYYSVGGIGKFGTSPFKELSKRFYSRIDPQNPLPALIIRSKNFNIFL